MTRLSLMEDCTEGFEIVRNTETEVSLQALSQKASASMILETHCETYRCWKSCSEQRRKLAIQT